MKLSCRDVLHAFIMGFVIPTLMLSFCSRLLEKNMPIVAEFHSAQTESYSLQESGEYVTLKKENGKVERLELETYLCGVVLGEMPTDFQSEALKAQAVVARTYTKKTIASDKHGEGTLCNDPGCCQAYRSDADFLACGGSEAQLQKVKSAVADTFGMVLTYEDTLIEATYFSCSGGKTEDAVAVWGTEYPYLVSVDSPGEEGFDQYQDTVILSCEDLERKLGILLTGNPQQWFGKVTRTAGDGVDQMEIGGFLYSGTDLRKRLGLRSTAFQMETDGKEVRIITRGYGHRVGLSQYGAEAMAASGAGYEEILSHYYPGTVLVRKQVAG